MGRTIALLFVVALGVALRVFPYALTGVPYDTDSYPLLRNTVQIGRNTPVHLGGGGLFDNYNIYWFATSLYGVVVSRVTGIGMVEASCIYTPLASALGSLILYPIVYRVTGRHLPSLLAALLFSLSGLHSIKTAGVIKEAYACPLYLSALLSYTLDVDVGRKALLFMVLASSTVTAHHLTTLVLLSIAAMFGVVWNIDRLGRGLQADRSLIILVLAAMAVASLHLRYAWRGFRFPVDFETVSSLLAYQFLMLIASLYSLTPKKDGGRLRGISIGLVLSTGITVIMLWMISWRKIFPFVPVIPFKDQVVFAPYILLWLFAMYGFQRSRHVVGRDGNTLVMCWVAAVLGLEGFALFSARMASLFYRLLNFLYVPVSIYVAIALRDLRYRLRGRPAVFKLALTVMLCLAMLSPSPFFVSVLERKPFLGGHGVYSREDLAFASLVGGALHANESVAGDQRMNYLLKYVGMSASSMDGYNYLSRITGRLSSSHLIIYREMLEGRYELVRYWMDVDTARMLGVCRDPSLNRVYDNYEDMFYRCTPAG